MHFFKPCKINVLVVTIACFLAVPLFAAELLVVDQPFCPYCKKFDREIATAYPKTDEGAKAPMVRVQLNKPWPDNYSFVQAATVTPSFILVHEGVEIDRIEGYPGDIHFWFLLNSMLDQLP